MALGVPGFGAVSGSLLGDLGGSFTLTLVNYRAVLHQAGQVGPLERSLAYAAITASITVAGGFIAAWLLTFCGVFLELPISQLLYQPGSPPASVAIQDNLGTYHFGVGMAQSVLAVAVALLAVVGLARRLPAGRARPDGGGSDGQDWPVAEPIALERLRKSYPGAADARPCATCSL